MAEQGTSTITPSTSWKDYLFEPVSAASLGIFRILWGGVMFYYFLILAIGGGKYKYLDTIFHFKYPLFEWVTVLPSNLMYLCFYGGVLLSIMMSLGLYYKFTSKALFVIYAYIFLLDMSYWNNHYYAYGLISAFFVISDANRAYSLDKKRLNLDDWIPRWQLLLFRFQFVIIYIYGGFSKLQNKDWMSNLSGYSMLQNNLKWEHNIVYPLSLIVTYGGLMYDLIIGFLLLRRKSLWGCIPFILAFNISNSYLFNIGTFPYAMIASFVLFIPPLLIRNKISLWTNGSSEYSKEKYSLPDSITQRLIYYGLITFVVFQLLFPFRSIFYEGSVFWTAEGKLCAWHMMASSNYVDAQSFTVLEYNEEKTVVQKREPLDASKFLNEKQRRTMGSFPWVIPQFAKFLKKEAELAGFKNVAITGRIYLSRNYRPKTLVIEPDIDLSALEVKHFQHNEWLLRYNDEDGYFAD
jgi:vitamin K-dependent gamma-carboxylase